MLVKTYIKSPFKTKNIAANHKIFSRLPDFPTFSRLPEKFPKPERIPD